MKIILSITFAFILSTGFTQTPEKNIRNIDYYNSLIWKNDASLKVYIDCTYTLPTKPKSKPKIRHTIILPYRYYPYTRYVNGYDPGFWFPNRIYY